MFITITILHGLTRTILLPFVGKKQKPYVRKTSYLRKGRLKVKTSLSFQEMRQLNLVPEKLGIELEYESDRDVIELDSFD